MLKAAHLVFGDFSATSAGNLHSNRPVGGVGAVVCADCRISRCRLRHHRSALHGVDLLRHDVRVGHPNRSRQDAAFSCRLLRVLRRRSRRCRCARFAAADFRPSAAPVPTCILARSCRSDAGRTGRLQRASARATVFFLTEQTVERWVRPMPRRLGPFNKLAVESASGLSDVSLSCLEQREHTCAL